MHTKIGWLSVIIAGTLAISGCIASQPSPTAVPTGGLEGGVTDARSGAPIEGAQVTVAGQAGVLNLSTDAAGKYRVEILPTGPYLISAEATGYHTGVLQVGVVANVVSSGDLTLEPVSTTPVVVTAPPSDVPTPEAPSRICEEILIKSRVWQGDMSRTCDPAIRQAGTESLKMEAETFSIIESYSPLIQVAPDQIYEVSYWVKTDLEIDEAEIYGRVIAAQYDASAQEDDQVNENRIDPGFTLGENAGPQQDWTFKSYVFVTEPGTAYVRLRAVVGGPTGKARGSAWFDQVTIRKR